MAKDANRKSAQKAGRPSAAGVSTGDAKKPPSSPRLAETLEIGSIPALIEDVSRRLQARERQQAAVAALGRIAMAGAPLPTLLDAAARALTEQLDCNYSKVLELQKDSKQLLLRAGAGWKKGRVGKLHLATGRESQAGYTLQYGGPVVVEDLTEETRFSLPPILREHGIVSGLSVIIGPEEAPWGVLSAHSDRARHYTIDDVSFLQSVANLLYDATVRDRARAALAEREQRLRLALGAARMGTWEWTPSSDAIVADERSCELLQVDPATATTPRALFTRVLAEDRVTLIKALSSALAQDDVFVQQFRIVGEREETRWLAVRGAPLLHDTDRPVQLLGVIFDITESKQAEEALRRSEERFQLAMDAVTGLVYDWDLRTGRVDRSEGVIDLVGTAPDEKNATHDWWRQRIHPEDRDRVLEQLRGWLDGEEEYVEQEYRLRRMDGSWAHVWEQGRVLRDTDGKPIRVVGSTTDISERKRAEERQRMLMAELDHRVKNILANIGAIASRTSQHHLSVKEFVSSLEGRIRAMAMAHSLLSAARWEGADLRTLLGEELAPFTSPTGHNISLDKMDIMLRPKASQSLALAVHELVTNAVKHGSLAASNGRINVSWHIDTDTEPARLCIRWVEMNGPQVHAPRSKGFGLTVLQDMIAHDLEAEVECDFRPSGLICTITFPVTQTVVNGGEADLMEDILPSSRRRSAEARPAADAEVGPARRLLLVEDAWAVGVQLKTILEVMGHEVVGPVTTVDEGLALAEKEALDGAILDIRLDEEDVFPVAEKLKARHVPFGFATGYTDDHVIPARFRGVPRISKPYSDSNIRQLVDELFDEE